MKVDRDNREYSHKAKTERYQNSINCNNFESLSKKEMMEKLVSLAKNGGLMELEN